MESATEALVRDLVAWIAKAPQPYDTVMEGWRTSCPRLSIWEDAVDRGLLVRERVNEIAMVRVTDAGFAFLGQADRSAEIA